MGAEQWTYRRFQNGTGGNGAIYDPRGKAVATLVNPTVAEEILTARETNSVLVEAMEKIVNTDGETCPKCCGNGAVYADGRPHYYSEGAPTIACPACGGMGKTVNIDEIHAIARAALAKAKAD